MKADRGRRKRRDEWERPTSNGERRTLDIEGISPCTLRILSPALSSFSEERETESGRIVRVFLRNCKRLYGMLRDELGQGVCFLCKRDGGAKRW
jgi:hypothetical protein